jgi:hypothetical protein
MTRHSIPLLRGKNVELGCGVRVRTFGSRRYLYFWHYEREGGRSKRREDYIGRVEDGGAREELLKRMAGYHAKAEAEIARRMGRIERMLDRLQNTSA